MKCFVPAAAKERVRYNLKWTPGYEPHRYLNVDVMHKVSAALAASHQLNLQVWPTHALRRTS